MKLNRNLWLLAGPLLFFFGPPAHSQIIDDFESYNSTTELQAVWTLTSPTLDETTTTLGPGTRSARMSVSLPADNGLNMFGDLGGDLSGATLHVWFRKDSASVEPISGQIWAQDGSMTNCTGPISSEISDEDWHEVTFDLTSTACDETDITSIRLRAWNNSGADGVVVVNFDNLTTDGSVPVELLHFETE